MITQSQTTRYVGIHVTATHVIVTHVIVTHVIVTHVIVTHIIVIHVIHIMYVIGIFSEGNDTRITSSTFTRKIINQPERKRLSLVIIK